MELRITPDEIARKAAQMLDELEVDGELAASVRLRLEPSPLERGQPIRVDWTQTSTADHLADEARRVLGPIAGTIGNPVSLRVEVLDGSGAPIRGLNARRTLRTHSAPPSYPRDPMSDPQASPQTATRTAEVLDISSDPLAGQRQMLDLLRDAGGGAPADPTSEGWQRFSQALIAMTFITQHNANVELRQCMGMMARANQDLAETVRKVGGQNADLVEDLIGGTIEAVKGIADFRVAATQAEADRELAEELAAATGRARPSKVDDLERISKELRAGLADYRRTKILSEFAKGEKKTEEKKPDPVTPEASSQAGVTPTPAAEEPSIIDRILSGDIAAEVGAELVLGYVGDDKKANIVKLARAMLASAGEEAK